MSDSHHTEIVEIPERPMSIRHLVHTLRAYAPVIALSMAGIASLYVVVAVALYLFGPSQRMTTQRFRLDFEGAADARYPNGVKFSSSDITSTPILLEVYRKNHLERFTTFPNFSRALFVLEANADYERLAAEYQGRLSDPRLSSIDRERIQREWQAKAASIAKNDYALNWLRTSETGNVPETLVKKVLTDTLAAWAAYAATEQHVLQYRLAMLSPQVVDTSDAVGEPVIAVQMLRSKIAKVLQNVDELRKVPGAELVRSRGGMSVEEIRLRLEEIVRFRLEPLTGRISGGGLIANRAAALRFLESQLAYDQRVLKATQDFADSIRQSLAVYSLEQRAFTPENSTAAAPAPREPSRPPQQAQQRPDTVMPQINDSFLDRLVALTSQSSDVQYRQKAVDDYRKATQAVIPAQEAVSYDQEVLALVKNTAVTAPPPPAGEVQTEIEATRGEVKQLVGQINDIYNTISRNLSPSKELYTPTAPPVARTEHARSFTQLALYGIALLALSLPLIVAFCLVHARLREEESAEPYLAAETAAVSS